MKTVKKMNYKRAGVDIKKADQLVRKIAQWSAPTKNRRVKKVQGGYASLYEAQPGLLVAASTDGVGTKLKLAIDQKNHRTIGIDLVAMCVNDLLCVGAKPAFFLDYFATGQLQTAVASNVIRGIVEGCIQADCALVGGETAEMPGMYQIGDYDLAGFSVGFVAPRNLLPKKTIRPGDVLIGVGSSGPHSNGYSLLRALIQKKKTSLKLRKRLLEPTKIYVRSITPLIQSGSLKGLSHITGGGWLNLLRLSDSVSFEMQVLPKRSLPDVFSWLMDQGLSQEELLRTYNMGYGMVLVVTPTRAEQVLRHLKRKGEKAWKIGRVIPKRRGKKSEVRVVGDSSFFLSST